MKRINTTCYISLLMVVSLLIMFSLPLSAREKEDSVYIFRFLSKKDMFYSPGMNNGSELSRLYECVQRNKKKILDHELMVYVNGYYIATGNKAEKRAVAKIRSNRVKSELITRKGLKENCFITKNQPGSANFVEVQILPYGWKPLKPEELPPLPEPAEVTPQPEPTEEITPEQTVPTSEPDNETEEQPAEVPVIPQPEEPVDQPEEIAPVTPTVSAPKIDHFALKTNLLAYGLLMPNLEIEWLIKDRWSVALEWQGAWYKKTTSEKRKVYRVSTIIPEARYWVIDKARFHGLYVGVFVGGGIYDIDNGKKGHKGEGGMVGVSTGYMWPISKHLSLDAGIGVGYLRLRDKEYRPLDGHFLYELTRNINYFGPLRLKLSLGWRF